MKKNILYLAFVALFLVPYTEGVSQVAINTDASPASPNTILDLNPSIGKAFLPPTMTFAQINAISPAKPGMVVYDSESNCLRMYNGANWMALNMQSSVGTFSTQSASAIPGGGYSGYISHRSVAVDGSGNVYIAGEYSGTAIFGALTTTATGPTVDVFIVKYNSSGTPIWVRTIDASDSSVGGIVADASGNVYMVGGVASDGTISVAGGLMSAPAGALGIIVKLNSSGTLQATQLIGTGIPSEVYGNSIAIDGSNNLYITGYFINSISTSTLPPTTILTSLGGRDAFVAKYNSSLSLEWAQKIGGTGNEAGTGITIDAAANVYVSGYFTGSITVPSTITSAGLEDIFIAKYNSSGANQWLIREGGAAADFASRSIAADASGNTFITGPFTGSATFGALPALTSAGLEDIFIAKYNTSGVAQWAKSIGSTAADMSTYCTVDAAGNVYITGYFTGTVAFAPTISLTASGSYDVFIAKYNTTGGIIWANKAGGAGGDSGTAMTIDAANNNNVHTVGSFTPTAIFGGQSLSSGSMFSMKYSQ